MSVYTDDTAIYHASEVVNDIVSKMNYDLENIDNWLATNKLCLNVDKTLLCPFGVPQRLVNLQNDDILKLIKDLLWHNQIDRVRKKF